MDLLNFLRYLTNKFEIAFYFDNGRWCYQASNNADIEIMDEGTSEINALMSAISSYNWTHDRIAHVLNLEAWGKFNKGLIGEANQFEIALTEFNQNLMLLEYEGGLDIDEWDLKEALVGMSLCYYELGKIDEALHNIKRAKTIEIINFGFNAEYHYAKCLFKKAIKELEECKKNEYQNLTENEKGCADYLLDFFDDYQIE